MASIFQRGKGRTWWIKYYTNGRQIYYSLGGSVKYLSLFAKSSISGSS